MFGSLGIVGRRGGGGPSALTATVGATVTGTVYSLARLLGGSSTLALISGTNSNLTLSSANITAAVAIGSGNSQVAVVRETLGQIAVEYPVTISGAVVITVPAAPTLGVPTAGNAQATLAWTDNSTGGAAITSHNLYRSTTAGFTPGSGNLLGTILSGSPYVDSGLTNGVTYYYALTALNSVGESNPSTIRSVSPLAPTLALSSAVTHAEGNSGTTAFTYTLTLTRNGDTSSFAYTWAVTGTGASPADVADFSGGVVPSGSGTFAPGETSKTITVLVAGDATVEPDETFVVTANCPGAGSATSNGTITNDDTSGGALSVSGSPAAAKLAVLYGFTPTIGGGTGPYTVSLGAGTLPAGLSLNTSTGAITGTATGI
jgi:hypothetical protein